jgi:hypothetical protein
MMSEDSVRKLLKKVEGLKGGYYKGYRDSLIEVLEEPQEEIKMEHPKSDTIGNPICPGCKKDLIFNGYRHSGSFHEEEWICPESKGGCGVTVHSRKGKCDCKAGPMRIEPLL